MTFLDQLILFVSICIIFLIIIKLYFRSIKKAYRKTTIDTTTVYQEIKPSNLIMTKKGIVTGTVQKKSSILEQKPDQQKLDLITTDPTAWKEHPDSFETTYEKITQLTPKEKNNTKKTVFVIDDSFVMQKYVKELLERNNYNVTLFKNGEDVISYLEKEKIPDLLIIDIEMPKMNGIELIELIKSNNKTKNIKIIIVSGHIKDNLKIIKKEQINGTINKPFDNTEFIKKINHILSD